MTIFVDDAPLHGDTSELYAYVAIESGKAGICAVLTANGLVPMIGMTLPDMAKFSIGVRALRQETTKDVQLIKYVKAEVITL